MSRVGIADLKAHLSKYLRQVRSGRSIVVLDRDEPIAEIVPLESEADLRVRRATRSPSTLRLPKPAAEGTDSLEVLLGDRRRR